MRGGVHMGYAAESRFDPTTQERGESQLYQRYWNTDQKSGPAGTYEVNAARENERTELSKAIASHFTSAYCSCALE